MVVTQGVNLRQEVCYGLSLFKRKQGAYSVTNSLVKYRVKTYYKCLYLIFLTFKNLYLYACFIYVYMYNGFIYDIYIYNIYKYTYTQREKEGEREYSNYFKHQKRLEATVLDHRWSHMTY